MPLIDVFEDAQFSRPLPTAACDAHDDIFDRWARLKMLVMKPLVMKLMTFFTHGFSRRLQTAPCNALDDIFAPGG